MNLQMPKDYLPILTNISSPKANDINMKNSHKCWAIINMNSLVHKICSQQCCCIKATLIASTLRKNLVSLQIYFQQARHQKNGMVSHGENSTDTKFPTRTPITSSPRVSFLNHPCKIICQNRVVEQNLSATGNQGQQNNLPSGGVVKQHPQSVIYHPHIKGNLNVNKLIQPQDSRWRLMLTKKQQDSNACHPIFHQSTCKDLNSPMSSSCYFTTNVLQTLISDISESNLWHPSLAMHSSQQLHKLCKNTTLQVNTSAIKDIAQASQTFASFSFGTWTGWTCGSL